MYYGSADLAMADEQGFLFPTEVAPWEEDDHQQALVATVVFPTAPEGQFDYRVPEELADQVEVGRRLRVPLGKGNRPQTAYCVGVRTAVPGRALKAVSAVLDPRSLLTPPMLRLTRWIAEHYLCPWGQVLEAVVPAGVRGQAGTRLATFLAVEPETRQHLDQLKLPPKQAEVLRALAEAPAPLTPTELARLARCTQGPITALRRKGLIRSYTERVSRRQPPPGPAARAKPVPLNADQQQALRVILDALHGGQHRTILIHGVTGSGKTEVYIQAIEEVVRFGRQAIVLVPEISLTPQTLERFRARFAEVAVLHSHLSDAERHWQWQRIAEAQVQVVVGARSAIFAPVRQLGLVVIDEEHEPSFKQESSPRYHAREVAKARCEAESVPLVLGSATPSLKSWYRTQVGRYVLVQLPRRVHGLRLPPVHTIDLRTPTRKQPFRGAISRRLEAAIREALYDGGQVILLLNRRGFSTHIQCPACGFVVRCPGCDIALTHHRTKDIALCHFCDHEIPAPARCPSCNFAGIRYAGIGTQKLEAEVRRRFPDAPCVRMDTDAMQARGSHQRALEAFRSGEARILLGTQMIAKGLDFPEVTLVGVINADTALHLPDFRAAERTFQLVTQVAGRTGRGPKGGRVLVQTYSPEHVAVAAATGHDYQAFAAAELPVRKALGYPPFSEMIRVVIQGADEEETAQWAMELAERIGAALGQSAPGARLLGPAPAPLAKLRGRYRYHFQVQGPDGVALREAVCQGKAGVSPPEGVQWAIDVDPLDML